MESWIFLALILIIGAITKNQSIIIATTFVMILKLFPSQNFMFTLKKSGINWGVTIITVAILTRIALKEVGFSHLLNAFKSPIGWVAIFSGIAVSLLSSQGNTLLFNQPEITVALILGTIIGVVFLKGTASGPVIASGITFCILQIIEYFFKK